MLQDRAVGVLHTSSLSGAIMYTGHSTIVFYGTPTMSQFCLKPPFLLRLTFLREPLFVVDITSHVLWGPSVSRMENCILKFFPLEVLKSQEKSRTC